MSLPRVECEVVFSTDVLRVGEYANAFRVLADSSTEVLLDFCIYSATTNIAKVVARVRVQRSFLALVDARVHEAVLEFDAEEALGGEGLFLNRGGGKVLLMGPGSSDVN